MDGRGAYNTRVKATDNLLFRDRDSLTPRGWSPKDFDGNRFGPQVAKMYNIMETMDWEEINKFVFRFSAQIKAKTELQGVSQCFDYCTKVTDDITLSADEKNCMRECYFKKQNSKDDLQFYFLQ